MPVVGRAIEMLGLRVEVVRSTAAAMLTAAYAGMRSTSPRRGEVSDYVATHALRGLGLHALVDQVSARAAALDVARWLADAKHPAWPLAAAVLDHQSLQELERGETDLMSDEAEAAGYPGELLRLAAGGADHPIGPDTSRELAYSRSGLAPYGIDLRLLHAAVRGGNTLEVGYISEPSAPAVVGALLGSMDDAITTARADEESWAIGETAVTATDPEVLLTLHALRRSPSQFAMDYNADDHPHVQAALMVVERLDPW